MKLELQKVAKKELGDSVRKARKFVHLQETLIPKLEARAAEKMEILKDNVRKALRKLKGVDNEALIADFDKNLFEIVTEKSFYFKPHTKESTI